MIRVCRDCQSPFSIEPEEEDWFRREGLTLPKRCGRCRAARRGTQDEYRTCSRCGGTFVYTRELQLYARTYGWGAPGRCVGGCADGDRSDETDEERAMRVLLETLSKRRRRADAPPIEMALEARGVRTQPRRSMPSPQDLFSDLGVAPQPDALAARLRDSIGDLQERRSTPDDLFGALDDRPSKKRGKKKRRPRPRR